MFSDILLAYSSIIMLSTYTLNVNAVPVSSTSPKYSKILQITSDDFFDHFTTYTGQDPTNGFINYTDMAFAREHNYIASTFNTALDLPTTYIGMDHNNTQTTGRNSVRLESKMNFTVGSLFVFDVAHVPAAFGQWSSFWLLGQDGIWPSSGEIDIFESVHQSDSNTITLHTAPGCLVDDAPDLQVGTMTETDCHAANANKGCGVLAPSNVTEYGYHTPTAGKPFNDHNGGVLVTEWTETGISVWLFDRAAVPGSLVADTPTTDRFPPPLARFSGRGCSFDKAFRDMKLIINIDACGDWAGKVWDSSGAAIATGTQTCEAYVRDNPSAFEEAYFEFASLIVYSS